MLLFHAASGTHFRAPGGSDGPAGNHVRCAIRAEWKRLPQQSMKISQSKNPHPKRQRHRPSKFFEIQNRLDSQRALFFWVPNRLGTQKICSGVRRDMKRCCVACNSKYLGDNNLEKLECSKCVSDLHKRCGWEKRHIQIQRNLAWVRRLPHGRGTRVSSGTKASGSHQKPSGVQGPDIR